MFTDKCVLGDDVCIRAEREKGEGEKDHCQEHKQRGRTVRRSEREQPKVRGEWVVGGRKGGGGMVGPSCLAIGSGGATKRKS